MSSPSKDVHPHQQSASDVTYDTNPPSLFSRFGWMTSRRTDPDDVRRPFLGSTAPSSPWWQRTQKSAREAWARGKGMILVLLSQFFGSSMNVMTKTLEMEGNNGRGFTPFQILFARMSITVVASYLYMWYAQVPHPFGTRSELGLLLLRATGGFFGVYGLYYSVQYLPLSEATVLTFLAPILSCYACSFFIPHESFTIKQQLAALMSLAGVVLIARPFSHSDEESADTTHRTLAIIMALVGVLGASCAYSAIRMIGPRCHPLVSVTYFSLVTTVVSLVAMLVIPSVPLELPGTALEWTLLTGLGVCGFLLQFLLTAGLSYVPPPPRRKEKQVNSLYGSDDNGQSDDESAPRPSSSGSRATFMLYTQMLFAVFYDRVVWGSSLSAVSWVGSGLILVSAMYVAMARESRPDRESCAGEADEPIEGSQDADSDAERRHGGGMLGRKAGKTTHEAADAAGGRTI